MYYTLGAVAFIIGCGWGVRNLVRFNFSLFAATAIITCGVYGGLLGSRILYVLYSDPEYLLNYPMQAFAFWQGGLAWLGGPPLAVVVMAIGLKLTGHPVMHGLGHIAPGLALSHALARISCLVEGCCYGQPTQMPWAIYSQRAEAHVHPTPIYSMGGELIAFFVLQRLLVDRKWSAFGMPLYFVLLGTHRFIFEFFRGDPAGAMFIPHLRFYQSVALILLILGIMWMAAVAMIFRTGRDEENPQDS